MSIKSFQSFNNNKKLLKENHEVENQNYMFFANLENICRMASEILEMNDSEIDSMLSDGHDWANDHISKSMEQISHVYNFLQSSMNGEKPEIPVMNDEEPIDEEQPEIIDDEEKSNNIKSFNDFK
jgi:hypothetical protein